MLIAPLITDKQPSNALSLFLPLSLSFSFVLIAPFEFNAIHSFHFFRLANIIKINDAFLPGATAVSVAVAVARLLFASFSAARNLHVPAPEWLLLFRQRPPSTAPPPPLPSRRSIVGVPLLLCCEKILKTSAKFMYSASTLAYCVKAQSVLNGLTMLCGAFSILAFNTPLPSWQKGYMSCTYRKWSKGGF